MGWMAWDLMRGVDVLLAQPAASTRSAIILLGAVAGGGDPAAVTAALDPRITCVVPFNFGGPQPETRYPLPEDAETVQLRRQRVAGNRPATCATRRPDGFLPWVIVGERRPAAGDPRPRVLLGPRPRPGLEALPEGLGLLRRDGQPVASRPAPGRSRSTTPRRATARTSGPIQRKGIYAALKKWFDIPVPEKESRSGARRAS